MPPSTKGKGKRRFFASRELLKGAKLDLRSKLQASQQAPKGAQAGAPDVQQPSPQKKRSSKKATPGADIDAFPRSPSVVPPVAAPQARPT